MRSIRVLFLIPAFLVVALGTAPPARGQDVVEFVELTMRDGSVFVGNILEETSTGIRFLTLSGIEFMVQKSDIRSRRLVRGRMGKRGLKKLDPTRSRLFFAATARPLDRKTAYVAAYELVFTLFAVGVGDKMILSGGLTLFPGAEGQLYYVAPKFTVYEKRNRSFAVGVLAGGITSENGTGGLFYGVSTLGPPDKALTLGAGFLFGGGEISSTPVLLFGAERQVSSGLKIISENYLLSFGSTELIMSGGIRIIGGRLTSDLALFTMASLLGDGGFPFLPWLSFTYNFDFYGE